MLLLLYSLSGGARYARTLGYEAETLSASCANCYIITFVIVPYRRIWLVSLFNKRFGIVFTNALARRGFLRFCGRLGVNERVLRGLQVIGNENVVNFDRLGYPRKLLKMGVLRG